MAENRMAEVHREPDMTAEVIAINPFCRKCGAALQLDEMHYYDCGDGTATCNSCEEKWLQEIESWRRSPVLIHKGNHE